MAEKTIKKAEKKIVPNNPRKTIKRLFSYYGYFKGLAVFGLSMIIISTLSQVAFNGLLSPVIDSIVIQKDVNRLILLLKIMALLAILVASGQYLGNFTMAKLGQKIIHRLRGELSVKIQKMPVSYYDRVGHGVTMSAFTNDMEQLTVALEQSIAQGFTTVLTVTGTFIVMMLISPILSVAVIVMLFLSLFVIKFIGGISAKYFRQRQRSLGELNAYAEEMLQSQKVIKVFNYEERAEKEFSEKNAELKDAAIKAQTFGIMLMPLMGNISYIQFAIIALIGAIMVVNGMLTVGNIGSFLENTRQISRPVTQISNQMNSILAAIAGAERIFSILDLETENMEGEVRLDDEKKNWIVKKDGKTELVPLRGEVIFKDVDFSYVEGKQILNDISLYAHPDQKIAFVGSTGAGKTTITNLINRFYEIQDGVITIDGNDIRKINKFDLRSIMSMVLQDVHLFEGTIADNIKYGNPSATREDIINAAKLANADKFIMQLKDGYDTYLDDDGSSLSQGEKQLISIARAAVGNPAILILDEATSSIDTRTEHLIEVGMDKLMKNRTTFIIAHRLSTVRHSDAIIVLEKGSIIERGDHDALMAMKGKYYSLNKGTEQLT